MKIILLIQTFYIALLSTELWNYKEKINVLNVYHYLYDYSYTYV